jgi:uncharacterized membrane protein YhaH (DUF805 family)
MGPIEAMTTRVRKSVTFSGRADSNEFWWFTSVVFSFVFWLAVGPGFGSIVHELRLTSIENLFDVLAFAFTAVCALPLSSAARRRLRDANQSGLYLWFPVICVLTYLFLITLVGIPSGMGTAQHHPFLPGAIYAFSGIMIALALPFTAVPGFAALFSVLTFPTDNDPTVETLP